MADIATMTTSEAGLAAGRIREGYMEWAYQCSANKWTFGYGATYRYDENGERVAVKKGDRIGREEAAELFAEQWREHEGLIGKHITRPITQYQFDVLADMAFQFGAGFLVSGAGNTTGLREAINSGAWERCEAEIARWHYASGRRDPGVYTRALSRVCQWNALPWLWIYQEVTPETIKRDARGRIIETPFMKLNSDGTVREMVTPQTALARARAHEAAARAKAAQAPARVPASDPAPPSTAKQPPAPENPPEAPAKPDPAPAPSPAEAPAAKEKPAPKKPRAPIIRIEDPYRPTVDRTVTLDQIPIPGVDPANGAKPMTESQRFWGLFWIGTGNLLKVWAARGLVIGVFPSWATYLAVDALQDPFFLGLLTAGTAAAVAGVAAAPALIRAGIKRLRKGDAEARQLTF